MIKSDEEILDDVFARLKGGALSKEVTGKLYKSVPTNSTTEDIGIEIPEGANIVGADGIQTATIQVSVYVADIDRNGEMIRNNARCRTLSQIALKELGSVSNGYKIDFLNMTTRHIDALNETELIFELNYKICIY